MIWLNAPIALSPFVRYGLAAGVGALLAGWAAWSIQATKMNALRADFEAQKAAAAEAAAKAEARIVEAQSRVIERVVVRRERVAVQTQEAKREIEKAEQVEPALTDPRCAWPDGVRDAVNRARAAGSPDRAAVADAAVRAARARDPRPSRGHGEAGGE